MAGPSPAMTVGLITAPVEEFIVPQKLMATLTLGD
jgi:hypothetical protein